MFTTTKQKISLVNFSLKEKSSCHFNLFLLKKHKVLLRMDMEDQIQMCFRLFSSQLGD